MKTALVSCMLFLVGCVSSGVPRYASSQQNLPALVYSSPLTTPSVPSDRIIRLVDSRTIQEAIRRSREADSLALSRGKRATCYIAGALMFTYVMYKQSQSDCEPGQICIE